MLPSKVAGIHYLAPENPSSFPSDFGLMQSIQSFQFSRFLNNFPNCQLSPAVIQGFSPQPSCVSNSNNSTSDEADEHQFSIIDERKQRRMISNRESARRSRMRKQRQLDELQSLVTRLTNEKHDLLDKLNHLSECHNKVVQENVRLKEEASDLLQMLSDLQLGSSYSVLRDLEEVHCNTAHLRAESSSQPITNSTNLLH